jgi:hypothetical protein
LKTAQFTVLKRLFVPLVGPYSVSNFWSKEHHHGILVFWDFGRIMAIDPMKHIGLELGPMGFFNISIKFLIERVLWCRIFEFWDFGHRRRWPWVLNWKLSLRWDLSNEPSYVWFWLQELKELDIEQQNMTEKYWF